MKALVCGGLIGGALTMMGGPNGCPFCGPSPSYGHDAQEAGVNLEQALADTERSRREETKRDSPRSKPEQSP